MRNPEGYSPYPFTQQDLKIDRLMPGVQHTLVQFHRWRDDNPGAVNNYLSNCKEQLEIARSEYSRGARIGRRVLPSARQEFERKRMERDLEVFSVRNMAEIPDKEGLARFSKKALPYEKALEERVINQAQALGITSLLEHQFSVPKNSPEMKEIEERLRRLYQILPERVVQSGAMGKVARTMLAVAAIAAYDLLDATSQEKREHFAQVVHGALVYGAVYAIIDDTLYDNHYVSQKDQEQYHEMILKGLTTGKPVDTTHLPDNPLTEEMEKLYNILKRYYPIEKYPHLYQAAESMHIAQDRDARLTMESCGTGDLLNLYPDIFIKSGMSRVVANILARRELDSDFYRRCINSMMVHQLRDDLVDYTEDSKAARVTAFTHPNNHSVTNPLYDMFAYDAYIANTIYHNTESILAHSQAIFLSSYLSLNPNQAHELLQRFRNNTPEALGQFILAASRLPEGTVKALTTVDQKLKRAIGAVQRNQVDVDPQTFILDRVETINNVIKQFIKSQKNEESGHELVEIMKYALEAGGKRIRPALTLMLAESLDVDLTSQTPLLLASELFQTASLLFDDLPWQDNSATRRGKPTAHTIYDASSVELTGIFMLMGGIGVLQELKKHYPPEIISDITTYTTTTIQQLCLGQNMDLHMTKLNKGDITLDDVLTMYYLKTASAIEGSLVPLMMLEKRPQTEIESIKQYAHHAGLVFQIRDDLLDTSSNAEDLGKDVQKDIGKINIVQLYGTDKAYELMEYHLEEAIKSCQNLPFNTNLLQGIVGYFAKRKR